ncbi:bacteriocin-like protein [Mucilaginibacter lappiensis]
MNLFKKLSREEMKKVKGGTSTDKCTADCIRDVPACKISGPNLPLKDGICTEYACLLGGTGWKCM